MQSYFESSGQQLIFRSNGETVVLMPWGRDSLRVRAAMMHEVEDTRYALLEPEQTRCVITTGEKEAAIQNGNITARLHVAPWGEKLQIAYYNQKGELLTSETDGGGCLDLTPRQFKPILGGDHRLTATFKAFEGERIYGMGQYQQEILDLKYCTLELAHRNSQASVPFFLSSRGYGFLWHNPAVGRAEFARNMTRFTAESTRQMDYFITAGDTPKQILSAYGRATGTVPMMPEYGLGLWQCKLRYWNQEQLLDVAREYKRRGVPISVIVIDFFHWPHLGDFRFDPEFFPDPQAMVKELKEMGIELMVSVWPQIGHDSENFDEMRRGNLLIKPELGVNVSMMFGGNSVFYDATNPRARRYVWEKCKRNYYDMGIRIFWLDEAEPEFGVYDYENYRYAMGPNVQIGNVYPQLYARTFYDGQREAGQENVVNLLRCAWSGSQRYGALVWSGDIQSSWQAFKNQICAGLNMGMSGIPWWTTDIGGFHPDALEGEALTELVLRWFQWGTFCPVMRLHGNRAPFEDVRRKDGTLCCNTGAPNEIWSYGEAAEKILTRYVRLRETMRDYIRGLMREAHETNAPVMRAMFYEFPREEICWTLKDQYMFGPDVLVAPVLEPGAATRRVYLPAGATWTHLFSGAVYQGGLAVEVKTPAEEIPVFLRDGAHAQWVENV